MTCDQRQDLWLEYVAGTLDAGDVASLRTHLASGCPRCAAALAEAETVFHSIPRGLPATAAPAEAWERLQDRIALHTQLEGPAEPIAPLPRVLTTPRRRSVLPTLSALCATAAVIVLGIFLYQAQIQAKAQADAQRIAMDKVTADLGAAQKQFTSLNGKVDRLVGQLADARQTTDAMTLALAAAQTRADTQIASLLRADQFEASSDKQPAAKGRLFWDKSAGTWTLVAQHLRDLVPGKTYELWIITADGKKLAAGTASPDPSGELMIKATIPAGTGELAAAALTDEPTGGVSVPTGEIQLVAAVGK